MLDSLYFWKYQFMKVSFKIKSFLSCLVFSLVFFSSCKDSKADSAKERHENDSFYFLGLQAADKEDEPTATRYFKSARKNASPLIAKRSAEALTLLGNVQDRMEAAEYLAKKFSDDESDLIIAGREFFKNNEFAKVISITNKVDFEKSPNELIQLRLNSLIERNDSRFIDEYFRWCIVRPLSVEHLALYRRYLALTGITLNEDADLGVVMNASKSFLTDEQKILEFHRNIHSKNYNVAFPEVDEILGIYEKKNAQIEDTILSDIGKASFYGTDNFYRTAMKFDKLADKLEGSKKFYAYFYAARMYDKAGRYKKQTSNRFTSALEVAKDGAQFDNCLWYLLDFQLRASTDDIIDTLKLYGSQINDPEYFDDFFESLSVLLISSQKWQDFYRVWKETNSNFSGYTTGKYAYISGRLIEEGLARGGAGLKTRQAVDAFTIALSEGTSVYYKVCALERLNILDKEYIKSIMLSRGVKAELESTASGDANKNPKKDDEVNEVAQLTDAGALLAGYAEYGFPQKIFTEWLINRKTLTAQEGISAAKFLSACGEHDTSYNVQSLRIATWTKENSVGKLPRELSELVYPRFFKAFVKKYCEEFGVPEYVMYALIRSESFFDPNAMSGAGAMGLSQLMESTAEEVAKKLKVDEYDIFDAETNIRFGTYYMSWLISKAEENNILLSMCGYNGGSGNVRKWIRGSKRDWATTGRPAAKISGISLDLWLETVPYEETRNYGKKLISTSALYGWLYYDKNPSEVVKEIFGWDVEK